jgi:arylsulfatase A-like enzyme
MNRRQFVGAGASALAALAASCSQSQTASQPPHIVLLMGDDHGWEETGYNGHPFVKTPVLDEMAASGLRLDRFHSASPICSPTRGSVMTGRHPNRYGTFSPGWSMRPEEITVAQLLHDAGYACGHFGKWHLGAVKAESPLNPGAMGFDEYLSHDNFFEMNPSLSRNGGPPERFEGEGSEIVVNEAIRFIAEQSQAGKPTFTVVWYGSPHEPYSGLPQDLALYDNLPERYEQQTATLTSMETGVNVRRPLNEVLRERYAEITAMDRSIGRLRQYLADNGLKDNTLVWYCGDNGTDSSGQAGVSPLRGMKADVYEGGTRVPGVVEWPARITAPRTSDVNCVTSDMLPTLCDLAGVSLPERPLDGISLKPLIDNQMKDRPTPICFWNYDIAHEQAANLEPYIDPELQAGTTPLVKLMDGIATRNFLNFRHTEIKEPDYWGARAILDNRYKLVIDAEAGTELFDLRADIGETANLIEAEAATAANLEGQLRAWQESVLHSLTGADY